MVLTKDELIASLQNEVRILVHLAGKVDKSKLDYRPSPKQRTTLELLQYMAIMGPTQVAVIKTGTFDRATLSAHLGSGGSGGEDHDSRAGCLRRFKSNPPNTPALLGAWTDADFRAEVDMFGNKSSRGYLIVNLVLGGHAAYRTQLFCYLKACGRDELNTMNLWAATDLMQRDCLGGIKALRVTIVSFMSQLLEGKVALDPGSREPLEHRPRNRPSLYSRRRARDPDLPGRSPKTNR